MKRYEPIIREYGETGYQYTADMTPSDRGEYVKLEDAEFYKRKAEWLLHNGGLLNEWPREHNYKTDGPLIPWLSKRVDEELGRNGS